VKKKGEEERKDGRKDGEEGLKKGKKGGRKEGEEGRQDLDSQSRGILELGLRFLVEVCR
jgi:hypothetical protein